MNTIYHSDFFPGSSSQFVHNLLSAAKLLLGEGNVLLGELKKLPFSLLSSAYVAGLHGSRWKILV